MRHVLQVQVHLVAHVEYDALANPRADVAFEHADDLTGAQRDERKQQELDEQRKLSSAERLVYDAAGQNAWEKANDARRGERDEHEQKLQPVGGEVTPDALEQRGRDHRHMLFFFLRQEASRPCRTRCGGHGHSFPGSAA